MQIELYQASVPVFLRYLGQLDGLLRIGAGHSGEAVLMRARLAPDMLPFDVQVQIVANFALRACFPLAGKPVPAYGEFPATFAGMHARVARAMALVSELTVEEFAAAGQGMIEDQAGETVIRLPAPEFLLQYALPNFFFHLSMVYAILRAQGVPLSKAQFDGFHRYS